MYMMAGTNNATTKRKLKSGLGTVPPLCASHVDGNGNGHATPSESAKAEFPVDFLATEWNIGASDADFSPRLEKLRGLPYPKDGMQVRFDGVLRGDALARALLCPWREHL
jgi:hypothetical protein